MPIAAIAIGAGAVGSALIGANAAKKASDAQAQAAANALSFQREVNDQNQARYADATGTLRSAAANYQPWLTTGTGANNALASLFGLNGGKPDYSSFYSSPDYQFAQQQGELGIERGANARGLNLSGGTLKDLATFNSGLASQQYGNYFNRLMGLSQLGQQAAGGIAGVAGSQANMAAGIANTNNQAASNIGNTMQGIGQAQASGYVGGANAISGGVNSGIQNSLLASYLFKNPSAYSGGGSTGLSLSGMGGLF